MIKSSADYMQYLHSNPVMDYVMIDPPWNYGMAKSKLQINCENVTNYSYWGKNNEQELVMALDRMEGVKAVAIWTTLPMLNATILAANESEYFKFRSMITWVKRHKSGKAAPVMAHYFLNTTEYLVILVNKKLTSKIPRTKIRTNCEALRGDRTVKPKCLESELMNSWPGNWSYIFSGPFVDDLNLNDDVHLTAIDTVFENT